VFEWRYAGTLTADQGFEVRVWRSNEPPQGAHNSVLDNTQGRVVKTGGDSYRIEIDITNVAGVLGRTGDYLWTVVVVQIRPQYQDLGIQAQPGGLRFEAGGTDQGGGGGGTGGGGGGTGGGG